MIAWFFLIVGILGLLGATFLFPLLMALCYQLKQFFCSQKFESKPPRRVAILIPAHNEELVIGDTLASIQKAIEGTYQLFPDVEFKVCVGADHCTDATVEISKNAGVDVLELNEEAGKWNTLKQLFYKHSGFEWIVFVDSGALWPPDMLQRLLPEFADGSLAAVFPSYVNRKAGTLEALNWRLERLLKSIENYAGGPVSSHGATVAYRAEPLNNAFSKLSGHPWYNDDVVLPLVVRAQNPQQKTKYIVNTASYDSGSTIDSKKEFSRRKRISYGNVEWIRELCGYVLCHDRIACGLALRRIFRLLWAYWMVFVAGCCFTGLFFTENCEDGFSVFYCHLMQASTYMVALVFILLISCFVLKSAVFRGVLEAAVASLLVPYYVFTKRRVKW